VIVFWPSASRKAERKEDTARERKEDTARIGDC
jgi:hypothetical protein